MNNLVPMTMHHGRFHWSRALCQVSCSVSPDVSYLTNSVTALLSRDTFLNLLINVNIATLDWFVSIDSGELRSSVVGFFAPRSLHFCSSYIFQTHFLGCIQGNSSHNQVISTFFGNCMNKSLLVDSYVLPALIHSHDCDPVK